MDPETREMIENTLELARDNNKMLRKVRGAQKREAMWRTLKAILYIAIAFGLFYYLQPYVDRIMQVYSSLFGGNLPDGSMEGLMQNFGN